MNINYDKDSVRKRKKIYIKQNTQVGGWYIKVTSWHGFAFYTTGPVWGESTGDRSQAVIET